LIKITNNDLSLRAINSDNLKSRVNANQSYGTCNFDGWVDSLIAPLTFSKVLDVCCGTGNQLIKYTSRPNTDVIGIDISTDSLQTADTRLKSIGANRYRLMALTMEEMFNNADLQKNAFDLISCFYGLYYSRDVLKTILEMKAHLLGKGSILIVGPYGKNNATLFEILQEHYLLPELVLRSATSFMEEEVIPVLSQDLQMTVSRFVNQVVFPNVDAVVEYWRASTFYSAPFDAIVTRDIEKHFQKIGNFVMEKHVLACVASKV